MNFKKGVAVFMAALMVSGCTVFAAESQTTADTPEVRIITYDEAVELAVKNNTSIKSLKDNIETLEDNQEKLGDALFLQTIPGAPTSNVTYLDSTTASILTSLNTIETNLKNAKYSERMLKDGCELVVKNYMTQIVNGERNVDILTDSLSISSENMKFAGIKYDLGMISETEYTTAKNDYENTKITLELTKLNLETNYNGFSRLLGLKDGEKYTVSYDIEYEKYPDQTDLTGLINKLTYDDPSLKIAEGTVNDAEFSMKYVAFENGASYSTREQNVTDAGRKYNDTKADLELAVKNGYITVKQAELNIDKLIIAEENAQKTYDNAVVNHKVGYITDIQLKSAELALKSAKAELTEAIQSHDLAKFMLERPYMNVK